MGSDTPQSAERGWLLVGLLTLVALAVRLVDLGSQGLWYDEAYSVFIARLPVAEAWRALVADGVHPPLYYFLLRGVVLLGDSEFALRLPSAIAGALTVPLVFAIGRLLVGPRAGLAAAGLLAIAPFHVWQSREARMYALLGLAWVACLLTYLLLLRRRSPAVAIAFVLAHAAAYLVHYFALFLPLLELLDLIVHFRKRASILRLWTGLQAISALPILAWALVLAQRDAQIFGIGWVPRPQAADLVWTLVNFTIGLVGDMRTWAWIAFAGCLALAVLGASVRWTDPEGRPLVVAWAFMPIVVAYLLSLRRPVYMDRFLLGSLPGLLLLVAKGWSGLSSRLRILAGAGLAAAVLAAMVILVFVPGSQREQWREAAQHLQTAGSGEAIVVRSLQIVVPLSFYYRGDLPLEALEVNRRVESLEDLAAGHTGVWLVYWNAAADAHRVDASPPFDPSDEGDPIAARWTTGAGPRLIERSDFVGVTLFHFEAP